MHQNSSKFSYLIFSVLIFFFGEELLSSNFKIINSFEMWDEANMKINIFEQNESN